VKDLAQTSRVNPDYAVFQLAKALTTTLKGQLADLAQRCLAWICWRLQVKADTWHAGLIAVKNVAYAWRQMVFFLSLLPEDEMQGFLAWAEAHLGEQRLDFRPPPKCVAPTPGPGMSSSKSGLSSMYRSDRGGV
jgi:hypothetical protein